MNTNNYLPYIYWIDTQKEALLQRVIEWSNINTYSLNIKGLEQFSNVLREAFSSLGCEIVLKHLPAQRRLHDDGKFHASPIGPALLMSKKKLNSAAVKVLLGGHFDTVYSPSHSFQIVRELKPGIMIGPGVSDMKGGIAILLTVLEALERSPYNENIEWEVLLTSDEEIGSPSSKVLYEEAALRNHLGILFEPSFPDAAFVSERWGSVTYSILVHGKAAHVGRDYSRGRSAVFALASLIEKLDQLRKESHLIINVADLEGKGPINIVPALSSCRVNFRSTQKSELESTFQLLQDIIEYIQEEHIHFEIIQDSFRAPKPFDQTVEWVFKGFESCANDLVQPFQLRSTGGVCDGNVLAGAGLPIFDTAGAIGGSLHTEDEYLITSSLVDRAKLSALFLFKLADGTIQRPHAN